jgi:hypothetical protein
MRVRSDRKESGEANQKLPFIAVVKIGSSSLRFALFEGVAGNRPLPQMAPGKFNRIGGPDGTVTTYDAAGSLLTRRRLKDQSASVESG